MLDPDETYATSPFDIRITLDSDAIVVCPVGEICIGTAPLLRHALAAACEAGPRRVIVDLADVTLLSAAGVSVLGVAAGQLRQNNRTLVCRNAAGLVATVLTITGMGHLLVPATSGRCNDLVPAG